MAITKQVLPLEGMHCASCAATITRTLQKLPGVESCSVNFATEKATIAYDPEQLSTKDMNAKLHEFGYALQELSAPHHNDSKPAEHDHKHHNHMAAGHDHGALPTASQHTHDANRAFSVLPLALFVFAVMGWEVAASLWPFSVWPVPMPMELWQKLLFLLSSYVVFWPGQQFVHALSTFVKTRQANMDTLVGLGTVSAYIVSSFQVLFPELASTWNLDFGSFFDVSIVVIGFILYGKYLESSSKKRTGEALQHLLELQAKTAIVRANGKDTEVPLENVKVGDLLVVKPGSKIPVDGIVREGESAVNEAMITGESLPVDKHTGDNVIGSTLNEHGLLIIEATQVGSHTLLAQIVEMVEQAQGSKAPIEQLADRVSSVFVPIVLVLALTVFALWVSVGGALLGLGTAIPLGFTALIGILVIACPCALGLATPTALVVGVGRAAQHGVLIKDAESLERLEKVTAIVLDKTGTLTHGKPELVSLDTFGSLSRTKVLEILLSLEKNSEHPLAQALTRAAEAENIRPKETREFLNTPGKGIAASINGTTYRAGNARYMKESGVKVSDQTLRQHTQKGWTPLFLAQDTKLIALAWMADTLKPQSSHAVRELQARGLKVVMLSGDDQSTAETIASSAGIDDVIGGVLPDEKAKEIARLQKEGHVVAMVGDGVNDAPALAQADIGIAMSTGTDIAISSAQLTLLKGDISKVLLAHTIAQQTLRVVRQNLFWAFAYNLIGIPLAAGVLYPWTGTLLSPVFAGAAMALSSVSVVANSLRLKTLGLEKRSV